jgi:hypothetical protein
MMDEKLSKYYNVLTMMDEKLAKYYNVTTMTDEKSPRYYNVTTMTDVSSNLEGHFEMWKLLLMLTHEEESRVECA